MILCDHFIYTSAKTREKEGYQIIAKSEGISDEILSEFSGYYYPVGADIEKFHESRSLLLPKKNKIAYSIIKNIGIGYDARSGTLYNHTFVIDRDQFLKINNDSRFFDDYFIQDTSVKGILEKIPISVMKKKINLKIIKNLEPEILSNLLYALFNGKKIALTGINNLDLIQNLIAVLPSSIRVIPFSTLLVKPDRQTKFNFIQIDKNKIYLLKRNWNIISLLDHKSISEKTKKNKQLDFQHMLHILQNENEKELSKIHLEFENIPGTDSFNKIRLLNYDNLSKNTEDIHKKAEYVYECAKSSQKLDPKLMSHYLDKVEEFSKNSTNKELIYNIEIGRIFQLIKESPLEIKLIEKVFDKTPETNPKFRHMLLQNILKDRKKEIPQKGLQLLEDALKTNFRYDDEVLKVFVTTKSLQKFIIELMYGSKALSVNQRQKILKKIFISVIENNIKFLPNLYNELSFQINPISKLEELAEIIHETYTNRTFRDHVNSKMILEITTNIRNRYSDQLNSVIKKSKNKIYWDSDLDYKHFKHISYDLLRDMSNCLHYLQDFRTHDLNKDASTITIAELQKNNSLLKLIKSISFEEKKISEDKIAFNPWKMWWPW